MSPPSPDPRETCRLLRARVLDQVTLGHFETALDLCDEAASLAELSGEQDLIDQVACNRAGILIAQGHGAAVTGSLRRILMRSTDVANRFQAAYTISQYHDVAEQPDRSLFYARQALRYAQEWQRQDARATAHNRLANLLLLESYFDEAREHYQHALDLLPPVDSIDLAIILSNLGYCHVVLESLEPGFRALFRSLRMMRRLDAQTWRHLPLLGLSYAYLDAGRYERARRHAGAALSLTEGQSGLEGQVKNALYLLGEAEKLAGDDDAAHEHFYRLQQHFYPDEPFIVEVLMATDLRKLINLMA